MPPRKKPPQSSPPAPRSRKPRARVRASTPALPGRRRKPPAIAWPGWGPGGEPEAGGPPPKSKPGRSKRPQPKAEKPRKVSPKKPVKKAAPRSRAKVPETIAEAFAQIRTLQAAIGAAKAEAAERVRVVEKENRRLRDEAEALRAKTKIPTVPGEELPEGFKRVEEERPAAPREIVYKRADEITSYLGATAGCLRLASITSRLRATFIARDNRRAEGELLIDIPRGMTHSELTYGELGSCIQRLGPLPGVWITLGWYFTVPPGEHDRYLRYRGGYAAFANAQHADTIGNMSANLITSSKLADSYQKTHRKRKPNALIFRLIWTMKRSPYYVGSEVWDRNGGQAPSD